MAKAILLETAGIADIMHLKDIPDPICGDDEILIKQSAIEVNYIDILYRNGTYSFGNAPKIPGVAAVGTVAQYGKNVTGFSINDRVGYALALNGAYTNLRAINKDLVFKIPNHINDVTAAAVLAKGMTAHMLTNRAFIVRKDIKVLVHAAAGGVGHLVTQYAKMSGAEVYGVVGSESKKGLAFQCGCTYAINHKNEDLMQKISEYSNKMGVNAVFDGIGAPFFEDNLTMLMPFGIYINYGTIGGALPKLDTNKIAAKSLFFTRPSIYHYKRNRIEMVLTADDTFRRINNGDIKVTIDSTFPLKDAKEAHKRLESGQSMGSIVLTVE